MPTQKDLERLYQREKFSVAQIAMRYKCSQQKINYWLDKYAIVKRSIADAVYERNNPDGDPFKRPALHTKFDYFIFGLGCGLYWGEGNKKNQSSVKLGNSDPLLISVFIQFLKHVYAIDTKKLRFGLQIFSDTDPESALTFWAKRLCVSKDRFQKVVITKSRGDGTYTSKTQYGVLTVYFNNRKLRDIICGHIECMSSVLDMKIPK